MVYGADFATRNDVIAYIESLMGSEGSHAQAEQLFNYIRDNTDIFLIDWQGYHKTRQFDDKEFFDLWNKALE